MERLDESVIGYIQKLFHPHGYGTIDLMKSSEDFMKVSPTRVWNDCERLFTVNHNPSFTHTGMERLGMHKPVLKSWMFHPHGYGTIGAPTVFTSSCCVSPTRVWNDWDPLYGNSKIICFTHTGMERLTVEILCQK